LFIAGMFLTPLVVHLGLRPFTWELAELLVALLPLEVLGYYLFLSALRLAPLSLVTPLLAFTPVLTVLTAQFLLGEVVSALSRIGIALVGVGAYILYIDPADRSLFGPLRALFANEGARRMMLAAAVWAVTSTLGKPGTQLYGAIQFGFLVLVCLTACFGAVSIMRLRRGADAIALTRKKALLFLIAGLFMAAAEVTHFLSLSMAPVACMISVKRISLVFGVLLGRILFGEQHVGYRVTGSSLMVAGLFFLYL
ncbi:MAG: EamA family transporter, partial [Desulfomonilaceae bacterium]